eukprot:6002029-Pyramimonas_sp.AAC.1
MWPNVTAGADGAGDGAVAADTAADVVGAHKHRRHAHRHPSAHRYHQPHRQAAGPAGEGVQGAIRG